MTILKCKMCGGSIQLTGEGHGFCQHCGSEITLPKIDDDKRLDFYNRGNYYRQLGDFDRAYSAFEHIIADDMQDAETHWCLTLCRYGVEYVQDPRSGEYLPTVSRMSYTPVQEDPDYLKAIEYADSYSRQLYLAQARQIATIQADYLEISRREKPYDVFICFKAEENNGQRTQGSIIAQDLYEELTESGVRTFFSRVTLRNIAGEKYEPYIFAALNSARVMLVVSNDPEHLQARWVRNEWSRFLSMKEKNASKVLIPIFKGFSPDRLPQEIRFCGQAVDASVLGYNVELKKRILSLLGKNETAPVAGQADVRSVMINNLLIRVKQCKDDKEFVQAASLLDQVQNMDPENGEAFFYRLLVKNKIVKLRDIIDVNPNWEQDPLVQRILKHSNADRISLIHKAKQLTQLERNYRSGLDLYNKKQYVDARTCLSTCKGYKNADNLLAKCEAALNHDKKLKEYKELVGDGKEYLSTWLRTNHYEIYRKRLDLGGKSGDKGAAAGFFWILLLLGTPLLIFGWLYMNTLLETAAAHNVDGWLFCYAAFSELNIELSLLWPILYCLVIGIAIFILIQRFWVTYFIFSGLVGVVIGVPLPYFLLPLIGGLILLAGIICGLYSIGNGTLDREYNAYIEEQVKPLLDGERQRLKSLYGSVLSKEEMIVLRYSEYSEN